MTLVSCSYGRLLKDCPAPHGEGGGVGQAGARHALRCKNLCRKRTISKMASKMEIGLA